MMETKWLPARREQCDYDMEWKDADCTKIDLASDTGVLCRLPDAMILNA